MKKISTVVISSMMLILPAVSFAVSEIFGNPNAPVENSFIVGPAKIETEVSAGTSETVLVTVENRTGRSQQFEVSFEDFVASNNEGETVRLLGAEPSKTTLKDGLFVENNVFRLNHGDRAIVPVTVSIPVGTPSGGRFGAVIVSAVGDRVAIGEDTRTYTGAVVLGRIASLLFVKVPGDVNESGRLVSFGTQGDAKLFGSEEIPFRIAFENSGNVSLNPYGLITITNQLGTTVSEIEVDPWYVLPESVRTRDINNDELPSGRYTATLRLNRGYNNVIDEEAIHFFVITPTLVTLSVIGVLIALVLGYQLKKRNHVA